MSKVIDTYQGNDKLKRKGVPIEWTKELVEEYIKCSEDPIYFAEKYVHIINVDKGFIPIELYDYQKEIIHKVNSHRNTITCCARQVGKTVTAVVIILHYILFNSHKTAALLANKGATAREILYRIQLAFEALPKWLQQGIVEWNKGSVTFENGSKIFAAATSSSSIRGQSINFLYIDESAFIPNWQDFMSSTLPTISSGNTTKMFLTSTPNGLNYFYHIWKGAKDGTNGYAWVEVPWNKVPGRDENWKETTLQSMNYDYERFEQEYNVAFLGSSTTLISGSTLKELKIEQPLREKDGMTQYVESKKGRIYVLSVDVSRGKGLDYSAIQVIDVTEVPYKQVCVYRNNLITPADFTQVIFELCKIYSDAYVLVEINDLGQQVADLLHWDYEYENIIYTENAGRLGKRVSSGFGANVDRGIRTTKSVKSVGCSLLKLIVEQKKIKINDFNTIQELSQFSRKGVSYEAENGHDDLVMCLVLFAWLVDQQFFTELTEQSVINMLRDKSKEQIEEEMLPFGFNNNDIDDVDEILNLPNF